VCFRLSGQRNYHKGVNQSASSLFQVGNRAGRLILGLSSCDASARPAAMRSFNVVMVCCLVWLATPNTSLLLLLLLNFLLHRLVPEFGVYFVAGCDEVWLHLG
jgi:sugar phosphate permease